MTAAQYQAWQRGGGHWQPAAPVADLAATLRGHGYTVYILGDASHMNASTPEDHTPFSATGWPFPAPAGWVWALDVMPGGSIDLGRLGAQLVADKNAAVPGAAPIKYMNWTPPGASCRHDSWEPGHVTAASSDTGHIHVSVRTDYQTSRAMQGYDPVARALGGAGATGVPEAAPAAAGQAPPWPGRVLVYNPALPMMHGTDVSQAQQRLAARGWHLTVDGWYGHQTSDIVRQFQGDSTAHGWPLTVDAQLGPKTWDALWRRPVT